MRERIKALEAGSCTPRESAHHREASPQKDQLCAERTTSEGISHATNSQAAFERIVRLVSHRDRSSEELRRRLVDSGFSTEAAQEALRRAKACGLIDDARFAEAFIRTALARGKGIAGIERSLADFGVETSAVEGWPDEFVSEEESELERALSVLKRTPPRSKNLREGAYRKLVSKGFSSSIAQSAARRWVEGDKL